MDASEIEVKRMAAHKKRVRYGYMMAIFCAIFWGIWYVPGTFAWEFQPMVDFWEWSIIRFDGNEDTTRIVVGILITALNAAFVMLSYFIWNAFLGKNKFKEMWRSVREIKACTKYYFLGAVCGGPIAILGSFMAMGVGGGAFAAVAALAYPVIGTILSRFWLGQKISHRAIAGILIILLGCFAIYGMGLISDLQAGGSMMGYVGGIMALCGWGVEGAIAARGIDVSEPDIAITMRFGMESIIWFIIILPILAIFSIPIWQYAWEMLTDPVILLTLVMLGITFGFCYVAWYKAFPLIGVGRGQGIGSLYGLCAIIFVFLFFGTLGTEPVWLVIGAILCTAGTLFMFTEKTENVEQLRDSGEENMGRDKQ